ncbi:MAG: diguanylate cyclase [Clostridiales bacterium]|nr:diguanylate cyclase [Clostridiales bacterium]
MRKNGQIGRHGGDEFLIFLHNTSREEGFGIIERIPQKIREIVWESDPKVTISGGIILAGTDELTHLFRKADQLLSKAKHQHKK